MANLASHSLKISIITYKIKQQIGFFYAQKKRIYWSHDE